MIHEAQLKNGSSQSLICPELSMERGLAQQLDLNHWEVTALISRVFKTQFLCYPLS